MPTPVSAPLVSASASVRMFSAATAVMIRSPSTSKTPGVSGVSGSSPATRLRVSFIVTPSAMEPAKALPVLPALAPALACVAIV